MTGNHEDTFVREGNERIRKLNNALLALEEDPDDAAVMDRCFRCAHTLKGNFAAQGYGDASDLAHAMEDLLDDVREGERAVETGLMDHLFAGVDALDGRLDEIEADEDPGEDLPELASELRDLRSPGSTEPAGAGERSAADDPEAAGDRTPDAAGGDARAPDGADAGSESGGTSADRFAALESALEAGPLVRASVELGDSEVPGAAGMLVLERLADEFDVVETDPPTEVVNAGDHDGHVDVFLEGADAAAVRDAASALQPVEAVGLTTVADVDFSTDAGGEAASDGDPKPAETGQAGGEPADPDASTGTGAESAAPDAGSGDAIAPSSAGGGLLGRIWSGLVGVPALVGGALALTTTDGSGDGPAEAASDGGGVAASTTAGGVDAEPATAGSDLAPDATPGPTGRPPDAHDEETPGTDVDSDAAAVDADETGEVDVDPDAGSVDDISSVRVDVEQLDELYGLVERLVTSRIKLRNTFEEADVDPGRDLEDLDKTTNSLQDTVMDMRLVPMRRVVDRFPRIVRDIARDQDKEVTVEMSGTDVELDRRILDRVSDPLVHVVRNAVDHGIEPPEERAELDKPREGTVELSARRERDTVHITIADDGRGIDPEEVRETALESGIRTERELDAMDDSSVYDLVFHPGFSTSDEVTEVSGRGVGMDVVYNTVSRLDGSVSVESTPGEGTRVTLELPVSVAIVKVLFVGVDGSRFGVPIKKIARVTPAEDIETVNGTELFEHEDGLTPVVRLHEALDTVSSDAADGDGMLVRVQASERPIALYCDEILDYEEVVVKPLDGVLSGTPGLGGTAVLGEGDVVPVLDVMTI